MHVWLHPKRPFLLQLACKQTFAMLGCDELLISAQPNQKI